MSFSGARVFANGSTMEATIRTNSAFMGEGSTVKYSGTPGELWSSRWVELNPEGTTIADVRDYANLHFQLLSNHSLPGNLTQIDESISTGMASAFASDRTHGGGIEDAAPNPIAYERNVDIYSLGSYDIDRTSTPGIATVRLDGPRDLGASFDTSGWFYFNGSNSWGVGARLSFSTDMFDSSFGGISFMFPIILDLDNNGVSIEPRTESGVFFNADSDIALERTAWVGSGDGLLAVDLDGDGKIAKANEIAFASRTDDPNDTDLEALGTLYDSNGDHQITSADTKWNELRVWVDANRNGTTENGELTALAARGITSISLVSDHNSFSLPDASRINGFGTFVMSGATRTLADAAIAFQTAGFTRTTDADGFRYSSDDNATSRYYFDMKIAYGGGSYAAVPGDPNALGFSSGALSTNPFVIYDGVLGSQRVDQLVFAAAHPMTLYGDAGNDTLETNGNQNDVLDGGAGVDILKAGGGDDTIFMDSADSIIDGGAGYDTGILTSPGNFSIVLGLKNLEAFISNNGNDVITASPTAAAYIDGRAGNDAINGDSFGDMLVGGAGDDTVHGGGGNDLVTGGAGNDKLFGDGDDDVLIGGVGADRIDGGNGDDTATFTGAKADFVLKRFQGTIYLRAANGESDHVTNVEHLRFDDQTIDPNSIAELPNINPVEYIASYSDLTADNRGVARDSRAASGLNHYREFGIDENRSSTFDGLAYIASYSDLITDPTLAKTEEGGANHYIDFGSGSEGRRVIFNPQSYLALNPDLAAQFGNNYDAATLHYIQTGYYQGRQWNQAPTVTAPGTTTNINKTLTVSTFVSASDPEGQTLSYYFRDNTVGGGSGRFWLNGNAMPEGQEFGLTAAQFASLQFKSGTVGDSITVHAWDGMASSANVTFQINAVNHAPVATASNVSRHQGTLVSGASLFAASDADNDTLTYSFYDNQIGNNSGRFYLNGVAQAEGDWFGVTQAQLANLTFKVGTSGFDAITVAAYDGAVYGSANFTVTSTNSAPVATAPNVSRHQGTTVSAASLFAASDADNDALTYSFFDNQVGNNSGRFWLNGVAQLEGGWFTVTAAQLANLTFQVGKSGSDSITVSAYDGAAYGSADFIVTATNVAPVVTASNVSRHQGATVSGGSLFGASDADGDTLTYFVFDNQVGGNSGRFYLNGVAQIEGDWFSVTQAQLANLTFKVGTTGSDSITVAANDGAVNGSADFTVTSTNTAPVLSAFDSSAGRSKSLTAANLFGASDADGDAVSSYWFKDNTVGGGHFEINGAAQAEGSWFGVTPTQFQQLTFKTGSTVGSDSITAYLYDGAAQSNTITFQVNTTNAAPVISATGVSTSRSHAVSAASLLGVNDPDGDAVSSYWFKDNTVGGGRFELNGVAQAEGSWFGVTPAQFQQLTFKGGSAVGSDSISAYLYDGVAQSNVLAFPVNTVNTAPVLTATGDIHLNANQVILPTHMFGNASDPDGDDYSIWLKDNTVGGGRFELNGSPLPEGSEFGLTSAQFQLLTFRAGPAGSNDWITGHLWDGNKQSAPDVSFHIYV